MIKRFLAATMAVAAAAALGLFLGQKPRSGVVQRVNNMVRTPAGWRIQKVMHFGGYFFEVEKLIGELNPPRPMDQRKPWTYKG